MEVTVVIQLGGDVQEVVHNAEPDQTVELFVISLCEAYSITYSNDIILTNKRGRVFKMSRKLSSYIEEGQDFVLTTWATNSEKTSCSCNQWWLLSVVAFFIGAAGVTAITIIKINEGQTPDAFGIVFDAGSSHTQMNIYKWEGGKENGTAVPTQILAMRGKGKGIADYTNPREAGESLQELVEASRSHIPGSQYTKTDMYLGATAGMRMLNERNKSLSDAIMSSVRETLLTAPFQFSDPEHQARIIDGKEEGSYGWVTINYLNGKFENYPKKDTFGSLDLGGASTQITFVPDPTEVTDPAYQETLVLYGYNYSVYTNSYLCYGSNEAHRKYMANLVLLSEDNVINSTITDPCLPLGNTTIVSYEDIFEAPCTMNSKPSKKSADYTFEGSSNSDQCHNLTKSIFNFNTPCKHPQDQCTFNGAYQPKLYGKFLAFSQFYYTMQFLNLTKSSKLSDFRIATEDFCSQTWDQIKDLVIPASLLQFITHYCFNAHFIDVLLTDGYGFTESNWNTITFINRIENVDLSWALGYMTNSSNTIPAQQPLEPISLALFILLVILFAVFILLAVSFACTARRNRKDSVITGAYSRIEDQA